MSSPRDLQHAVRVFTRHPGIYVAALLTLAIGIGAVATMFSIVNAVLLAPLPFLEPDQLALVWDRAGDSSRDIWLSPPEFADLRSRASAFGAVAAMTDRRYTLTGQNEPEDLQGAAVTPNLFDLLGVRALAGRTFADGDDRHGSGFVAILGEALAARTFGSASAAVGQTVTLDGQGWTVVGVLPRSFGIWPPSTVFPKRVDVWVPIDDETYTRATRNQNFLHALVRLKPGVGIDTARADVARVATTIARDNRDFYRDQAWTMTVVPLRDHMVTASRSALLILLAAVGVLLVVACANVGNLLLARAGARAREMAVRTALGATRKRLVRQLLTEGALLATIATPLGILVAAWAVSWAAHAGPGDVPRLDQASIDMRAVAFTIAVAAASTLLFSAAPVLQLSDSRTGEHLNDAARGSTSGPRARRVRAAFVVTQIACAVVLTTGTGLLVKAFVQLGRTRVGFEPDAVATGRVRLPASRYPSAIERSRFFNELTARLVARGDVASAGAVTQLPMSGAFLGSAFAVPAGLGRDAEIQFSADLRGVTPGYFDTLSVRLVDGRVFDERDNRDSRAVAVIDETLAHRFWPDRSAVGRHLRWVRTNDDLEIIGVVAAVRHYGLQAPPRETVYRPYAQYAAIPEMFVETRSPRGYETARAALVEEVRRLDPDQPVSDVGRVDALVEASIGQPRFNTLLLAAFAAIAVLLAAIGIYGVMAFAVSERTQEIGVRVALGATSASVKWLVVRDGAAMTAAGLAIGVIAAFAAARALRSVLFGVAPWDPAVFVSVPLLLGTVAMFASYLPAARAARLDATIALRGE